MAATGVKIGCTGAVLSTLLHEQLRTSNAQEGFLLGEVRNHISEHISDSQICNEKMETLINVSSFLPCTMIGTFYARPGEVNEEKLHAYMGSKFKNVVGWYRCRGSSCENLYIREMLVHKQLKDLMKHTGGNFIMCIMSCNSSMDPGTITVSHKFMMLQNNRLEGVPLQVINMGDTKVTEYLLKPQNPALYSSNAVQSVLTHIKNHEPGVQEAETLHSGLLEKLGYLLPQFSDAQQDLEKMFKKVNFLRHLCNSNSISPDFLPKPCQLEPDQNLMEFEEITQSPPSVESQTGKGRGITKTSIRRKESGRGRASGSKERNKPGSDPFGFVDKEMEKLQVKSRSSPASRISRSRTNTPSPVRLINKSQTNGARQGTPPRYSSASGSPGPGRWSKENSPIPSGSPKDNQQGGVKIRQKSSRGISRTPSRETNSPSRITRGKSPSLTNAVATKPDKPKIREAWSEKTASDSQEF